MYDYDTGRITTFLCSVQHSPDVEVSDFRHIIESMMVLAACEYGLDGDFTKLVNPTGRFVLGGSYADCGVTGRKLACDKKSSVLGTISTIANVAWKVNGTGGEKPMSAMKFVCRMLEEADGIIK